MVFILLHFAKFTITIRFIYTFKTGGTPAHRKVVGRVDAAKGNRAQKKKESPASRCQGLPSGNNGSVGADTFKSQRTRLTALSPRAVRARVASDERYGLHTGA